MNDFCDGLRTRAQTRIEQNQAVGSNEVDPTTTRLTTEKKDKLLAIWIVELINKLLTFGYCHCSVQPEESVPSEGVNEKKGRAAVKEGSLFTATQFLEKVESLSVIAN